MWSCVVLVSSVQPADPRLPQWLSLYQNSGMCSSNSLKQDQVPLSWQVRFRQAGHFQHFPWLTISVQKGRLQTIRKPPRPWGQICKTHGSQNHTQAYLPLQRQDIRLSDHNIGCAMESLLVMCSFFGLEDVGNMTLKLPKFLGVSQHEPGKGGYLISFVKC